MARTHRLPSFPSQCQIFRGGLPGGGGVQVYSGKAEKVVRAAGGIWPIGGFTTIPQAPIVTIYLPVGTDVRGILQSTAFDFIQWAGLATWVYQVVYVDDVADGFANKFRVAYCLPFLQPTPLP